MSLPPRFSNFCKIPGDLLTIRYIAVRCGSSALNRIFDVLRLSGIAAGGYGLGCAPVSDYGVGCPPLVVAVEPIFTL